MVEDPTGMGRTDVLNKRLRTLKPAAEQFVKDPVQVIRAIKYTSRGFIPEDSIDKELRTWESKTVTEEKKAHFRITYQGHSAKNKFLQTAMDYDILKKFQEVVDRPASIKTQDQDNANAKKSENAKETENTKSPSSPMNATSRAFKPTPLQPSDQKVSGVESPVQSTSLKIESKYHKSKTSTHK